MLSLYETNVPYLIDADHDNCLIDKGESIASSSTFKYKVRIDKRWQLNRLNSPQQGYSEIEVEIWKSADKDL